LVFSILGFLAGVFTEGFELPLSAKIGCGLIIVVGMGLIIPLAIASFGPGLIRQEE
jgi:serine acetyltransferase